MSNTDDNLEQILFDGLNEHGFLFQEKCAEVLQHNGEKTAWVINTTEYPVSIKDRDSRVDIVLRDTSTEEYQIYAVVECKRVNPASGYWLFGKPLGTYSKPLLINLHAEYSMSRYFINYAQLKLPFDDVATYLIDNWWLEIGKRGNKRYSSPNPIEDAFLQACIGVSGMAQELELQCKKDPQGLSVLFIPVVITSAPLYVAMYDLKDVDLTSGSIEKDKVYFGPRGQEAEKMEWILVDYGISGRMSPERLGENVRGISPVELEEYHKRSIFVVNSEYIVKFFARLHLV
jgi:hypothetical protein